MYMGKAPRERESKCNEKRANYTFDVEQLAQLKALAKLQTTPTNPVTVSKLLKQAVGEFLLKYAGVLNNGASPKKKPAAAL